MTLIHCLPLPMMIVVKCSPQTDDAKHLCLMPLSESISLSHLFIKYQKHFVFAKNDILKVLVLLIVIKRCMKFIDIFSVEPSTMHNIF